MPDTKNAAPRSPERPKGADRLAEALRENLKRRKAQARKRAESERGATKPDQA